MKAEKYECPECKCFLSLINPLSAMYACDCECYFSTREGKKHLEWYKTKYPEKWEEHNSDKNG